MVYLGSMTRLMCVLLSCGLVKVGDFFGVNRFGLRTFGNVYTGCMSSLGALRSAVLSDSELSFLVCFGSTVLGLFDFLVWFVSGVLLSRVPVGLESANVCDSTASAVCILVREGVCVTVRSGMRVLCCIPS